MVAKPMHKVPWWAGFVVPSLTIIVIVVGVKLFETWLPPRSLSNVVLVSIFIFVLSVFTTVIAALVTKIGADMDIDRQLVECGELLKNFHLESSRVQEVVAKSATMTARYEADLSNLEMSLNTLKQIMFDHLGKSLVNYEDLARLEAEVKPGKEIWILTSSMQLEETDLKDIILKNLKNGVVYKYLLPMEDRFNKMRFQSLALQWQKDSGLSAMDASKQIQCFMVPSHVAYMTVIIYDPYSVPPVVLVKFPTGELYTKQKYPLIYKVEPQPEKAWKIFVDSLQSLLEDERPCTLTKRMDISFKV